MGKLLKWNAFISQLKDNHEWMKLYQITITTAHKYDGTKKV